MVAHLVRLKLALLGNGLRRSAWQVVGLVLGLVYGLLVLGLVVAGLAALSTQDTALRQTVTVVVGSVLVLGWWFVPLVAFGVDATLDPARFVTFAIPRRSLLTGLAIAGLVGIPGAMSTVTSLAIGLTWWRDPLTVPVALLGAAAGLALAVVGGRAISTVAAPLVARRRVRELLAVLVVLLLASIGPALGSLSGAAVVSVDEHTFDRPAQVLAWTPAGAPWAAAGDAAAGRWGLVVVRLVIAAAGLVLAWWVWGRATAHVLVNPPHQEAAGPRKGLGWFGRLPATPLGAVTARCLTYWVRDPRYALALVMVPLTPVLLWVVGRGSALVLISGPIAAFFVGWGISADLSYDGTAFWTHVAAPLRGVTDRLGRVLASATIGVPVVAAIVVSTAAVVGASDDLPALLGASLGVLLTAYGGASVVSALVVMPVQQPGENPFATRQGTSLAAFLSQTVGWMAVIVLALPEIVLAWLAVRGGPAALGVAAALVGLVLGAIVLVVGVRTGGRVLDRRAPLLLHRLVSFS
ncbi:hypothetical protein [Cellulomonas composti]|uniref:Transporter n=1 Tax=Cellulomonas composti TaxID=266130 RepID=A0A511JA81_9CELL|nr:hypothetical protein [Cellulomonas composti]GEL94892.1 hypothetical protein CCO02nite_15500 [Cellulomonas composti]